MDHNSKISKLDIPELIQMMQAKSLDSSAKKGSKLFPYIETYGRRNHHEENLLMNKTIKFRESYMHNRTLRYMEPTFSYNQVLTKLKNEVISTVKPKERPKLKIIDKGHSTLKEIISKTELYLYNDMQSHPYNIRSIKIKSQFPNRVTKMKKFKVSKDNFGRISPDILRVTNIVFKDNKSKNGKKNLETLTFYKDMPTTQEVNASEYLYLKPRYSPNIISKVSRSNSPKLTCDAVSNTDLPI